MSKTVTVIVTDRTMKAGFDPEVDLIIEPETGSVYVRCWRGKTRYELNDEPADPETQRLAIDWATSDPEAYVEARCLAALDEDGTMRGAVIA